MMEHELGNVFVRSGTIDPGKDLEGHTHNFDHVTYCAAGRLRIVGVDTDGTRYETVLEAGQYALIRAEVTHTLINEPGVPKQIKAALDDMVEALSEHVELRAILEGAADEVLEKYTHVPAEYRCIYAHREPQGGVVQRYTGWPEAYR